MTERARPSASADVCEFADQALSILRSAPAGAEYFSADLEWLEQRLALWRGRSWRVGVIGITSSGKSTLLNALLGGQYLPARVGPSTNCLVLCSKGPLGAVVRFDNGRVEELRDGIRSRLDELGDERHNAFSGAQLVIHFAVLP
jgi:GTPase SAR1 family protein